MDGIAIGTDVVGEGEGAGRRPDSKLDGQAPTPTSGLPQARLQRVTQHIQSNLHRGLPLAELSAVVNMSPYHFARLFKRSTSVPPHRFVVRQRIDAAATLLTDPEWSIQAIAKAVGFRRASHFTNTFRRITGATPSVYRNRLRGK